MTGQLFIVSAPSGAGKTTLVRQLLASDPAIRLSLSTTTRKPRPGEEPGVAYNFVDAASFAAMAANGDFIESATVHGNSYGTSRAWVEGEMARGNDIILEIDWQGAAQVRRIYPQAVSIFILPPSLAELAQRLNGRGTDAAEVIARRLDAASAEMQHVAEFDYVIINDHLPQALADLGAIVRAARLSGACQQARHPALFAELTSPHNRKQAWPESP